MFSKIMERVVTIVIQIKIRSTGVIEAKWTKMFNPKDFIQMRLVKKMIT